MAAKFTQGQGITNLDANGAPAAAIQGGERVVKPTDGAATPFDMPDLGKRRGKPGYDTVKSKYGPLASTDPERANRNSRDRRFALDPEIKVTLSVEEEEAKVINARVAARLAEVEERARAKAEKEGFDAGFEEGRNQAEARFHAEAEARFERVDALLEELESAKASLHKANERYLIELVFRVARQVCLKEISTDREYVTRLASQLIERSRAKESIRVQVSPADLENLGSIREGLLARLGELHNLDVQASPDVRDGGCIVSTDWSSVDASVRTQLENIHRALVTESPTQ